VRSRASVAETMLHRVSIVAFAANAPVRWTACVVRSPVLLRAQRSAARKYALSGGRQGDLLERHFNRLAWDAPGLDGTLRHRLSCIGP